MGGHSHQHGHVPQSSQDSSKSSAPSTGLARQNSLGNAHLAGQLDGGHGHSHDHGVEPSPGSGADVATLDTERPVGDAIPGEVRDPLFVQLRGSDRAVWLMDEIVEERGDLDFEMKWSDRGSYHRSGSIWLDRNRDASSWFGTMAHEMVHLLTFVSGKAADAKTMQRDEFVSLKMEDEINAQAVAYVACLQTGIDAGGAGYDEFYGFLREHYAGLLVSETDQAADQQNAAMIEDIAIQWLEDKYRNEWQTSNTKENYYIYWGKYWDRINPGG